LIFEIGLLFIQNGYDFTILKIEDFKNILEDLKNPESQLALSRNNKFISVGGGENISKMVENPETAIIQNQPLNIESINSSYKSRMKKSSNRYMARKPSGIWRKGDDVRFMESINLANLRKIYSSSPGINIFKYLKENFHSVDHIENSTKYLKHNIYPKWWGGSSNHNFCERNGNLSNPNKYSENENEEFHKSLSQSKENFRPQKAEVYVLSDNDDNFVADNRTNSRSRFYRNEKILSNSSKKIRCRSKSRINYNNIEAAKNTEMYDNLKYVESKIRPQIENDKNTHKNDKMLKSVEANEYNTHKEWKYKENSNSSKINIDNSVRANKEKKQKVNYMISYDKNLKPEAIKEKFKEKVIKKQLDIKNSYNNSNNISSISNNIKEEGTFRRKESDYTNRNIDNYDNKPNNNYSYTPYNNIVNKYLQPAIANNNKNFLVPGLNINNENNTESIQHTSSGKHNSNNQTADFNLNRDEDENIRLGKNIRRTYNKNDDISFKNREHTNGDEPILSSFAVSDKTKSN
jgi:hypothetical protein